MIEARYVLSGPLFWRELECAPRAGYKLFEALQIGWMSTASANWERGDASVPCVVREKFRRRRQQLLKTLSVFPLTPFLLLYPKCSNSPPRDLAVPTSLAWYALEGQCGPPRRKLKRKTKEDRGTEKKEKKRW
jgi:hypothetical protein